MCIFCSPNPVKILMDGKLAYVLIDDSPVTEHHCLVITKRHFASFFDITEAELAEVKLLLCMRKIALEKKDPSIKGFNIGINDGQVSGQSVLHLHVHLIPRRFGDVENPRGGVRGIIPDKKNY